MKKIIKIIGVALLLTAFSSNSNAQFKFSAGLDVGTVLEEGHGLLYGLALGGEYGIGDNMGVSMLLGYDMISVEGDDASAALIPFQPGFKYYFDSNESGPYAQAHLGFTTYKLTIDYGFGTASASSTHLSYGLGGGYLVNEHIDLGVRYNIVSGDGGSLDYIALRAAYIF